MKKFSFRVAGLKFSISFVIPHVLLQKNDRRHDAVQHLTSIIFSYLMVNGCKQERKKICDCQLTLTKILL